MVESDIEKLLNDQINLDIITSYSKGKSQREIAEETGKESSYVGSVIQSLRDNRLVEFGRWNVDVQALSMIKTLEFRAFTEDSWNEIYENNFFLSYLSRVKIGKTKYLAIYTFPKEIKERVGTEISSWYYSFPHFKIPFFSQNLTEEKFLEQFEEEDNRNPLPHRGEKIENPNIIDFLIGRYVQLEKGDIDLEKCTKEIKGMIGDTIDLSTDEIRAHFEELIRRDIIYPVIPLDFSRISYGRIYSIISSKEIFRLMKTLNKFDIITGISFMEGRKVIILIQCPYESQNVITNILDQLDSENEMYIVTKVYENRSLPYKYYLEKFVSSQKDKKKG